ncbi:uncharacterized protein TrAtP1_002375 [Trichoderma atroviride]|uniref:uncharacterized protein n=1 Tax=Hypocrea atroviridis TaxID=63577 RepID=UPI003325377D|nr:hypothetical protein TrAtP1_002375 [Trichoderma atroviride]
MCFDRGGSGESPKIYQIMPFIVSYEYQAFTQLLDGCSCLSAALRPGQSVLFQDVPASSLLPVFRYARETSSTVCLVTDWDRTQEHHGECDQRRVFVKSILGTWHLSKICAFHLIETSLCRAEAISIQHVW